MSTEGERAGTLTYLLSKSSYFTRGRAGRVTHALGVANGFAANGWRVNLVSGPGKAEYRAGLPDGVRWIEVPSPGPAGSGTISELRWRLAAFRTAASLLPDSEALLFRYAISQPLLLLRLARAAARCRARSVLEVNSLAYHHSARLPAVVRRLILRIEATLATRFDLVYVVSERVREDLLGGGCTADIRVVPNAASSRSRAPARVVKGAGAGFESGREFASPCRLVYLGSLHPYYDFDVLLDAFVRLREEKSGISLVIYGDGSQLEEVRARARDLPDVRIHGRYALERVEELIDRRRDVLILPLPRERTDTESPSGRFLPWLSPGRLVSGGPESDIGSPTKLFEYLSLGACVVASDVGQPAEILSDRRTGYLYEADDPESLAAVLAHVCAHPEERAEVAERGRREFLACHTWEIRMRELIGAIEGRAGRPA